MKEKIKYCMHYDEIVDYPFDDSDTLSYELRNTYLNTISSLKFDIKKINILDNIFYRYIIDIDFYNYIQNDFKIVNSKTYIIDYELYLIDRFNKYNKHMKIEYSNWY
ncbi:MAG: hypothetical protein IJZ36_00520 [Bacilli bacterium]|nr:hypothetical protein [Bacilli bacterium]